MSDDKELFLAADEWRLHDKRVISQCCPHCGRRLRLAVFCHAGTGELVDSIYCPHCARVSSDTKWSLRSSSDAGAQRPLESPPASADDPPPPSLSAAAALSRLRSLLAHGYLFPDEAEEARRLAAALGLKLQFRRVELTSEELYR